MVQLSFDSRALRGAAAMLAQLRAVDGIELAIATGCWLASAEHKLRRSGIDVDGIPIGTASDAMARVEILEVARRKVGAAEEIIYLGDAVWDVHATKELGWRMIGIGERIDELISHGIEHAFADYSDPGRILDVITA